LQCGEEPHLFKISLRLRALKFGSTKVIERESFYAVSCGDVDIPRPAKASPRCIQGGGGRKTGPVSHASGNDRSSDAIMCNFIFGKLMDVRTVARRRSSQINFIEYLFYTWTTSLMGITQFWRGTGLSASVSSSSTRYNGNNFLHDGKDRKLRGRKRKVTDACPIQLPLSRLFRKAMETFIPVPHAVWLFFLQLHI